MKKIILLSLAFSLSLLAQDYHMDKAKSVHIEDTEKELLTIYMSKNLDRFRYSQSISCTLGDNGTHCAIESKDQQLPVSKGSIWIIKESSGITHKIFF